MGKKLFYSSFAAIFSLLLVVQGYFALYDDAAKELRADRIGASFVDSASKIAGAGSSVGGMSVYLTVESENNENCDGQLFINGALAGNFRRGILTVQVREGDELALKGAEGVKFSVTDYPDDLDETRLPEEITGKSVMTSWGRIVFK